MSLSGGMMMLRAMVLGWLDGLYTAIHERVLYPSRRLGGAGNDIWRARKPPPPLFYSVATEMPRRALLGISVNRMRVEFLYGRISQHATDTPLQARRHNRDGYPDITPGKDEHR